MMMKSIIKAKGEVDSLELVEKDIPIPGKNDVLIKVELAAICGTDVHIKEWNEFAQLRMKPPVVLGHELCGEIVGVGDEVDASRIGELVSAESHIACNKCSLCLDGKHNVCINTKGIGLHIDGCFAEYIVIPSGNAIKVSNKIPRETIAVLEPLGVAVHACTLTPVSGKSVAIVGCGPIGLMAVKVAKTMGAKKIICVELNEYRMQTAVKMGADEVINPVKEDVVARMKEICDGLGPEVVLEFSGSVPGITSATKYIRAGGNIVAAGLPSVEVSVNFTEVFYRGVNILGISGREMYRTWNVMLGLLEAGMDVQDSISHILPLEEFEKGFDLIKSGEALKVILKL